MQGFSLQQLRRESHVSAELLRSRARQLKAGAEGPPRDAFSEQGCMPSDHEQLRRLQRENHRLQQREFFKSIKAYFPEESR